MNTYVALGDSVASGLGAPPYVGMTCWRSESSYPTMLATELRFDDFVFNACGGASTTDVITGQLNGLNRLTKLVTITTGANDLDVETGISACMTGTDAGCRAVSRDAQKIATDVLPGRLSTLFSAVGQRAPSATIIVTGYPHFFETGTADGITPPISLPKRAALNDAVDALNAIIADQAEQAGAHFADVRPRFATHGLGGADPWIAEPTDPAAFHPTLDGYREGYLPVIKNVLG